MPIRNSILAGVNHVLGLRDLELRTRPALQHDNSMDAGLRRAARLVPEIATVIDIGAAAGTWTQRSLAHFPRAKHLLIEPLHERKADLDALCAAHPNVEFALAAAGESPGEVVLNISGDLDSSGIYGAGAGNPRTVPVTTIDREIAQRGLPAPCFLKLDTHGFELPILAGARETLDRTALLMIEAYNFVIAPGCVRFFELCAWLEARGFRVCDIVEPLRRPGDTMLWQMDLVFVRSDHPAFSRPSYR
jgi:FkbM family methyltransferase